MVYRRYGKFCFRDYYITWVSIAFLTAMIIATVMLEISLWLVGYELVIVMITLWSVLSPHRECFTIEGDNITILNGNQSRNVTIPKEIVIVISYVDICPLFAKRTAFGNQTHILKDKYAVTILQNVTVENVLEHLHRSRISKYTTSMMEDLFVYKYVYSFVCNQELFANIIASREYSIIVPESIKDMMDISEIAVNTHVDIGH